MAEVTSLCILTFFTFVAFAVYRWSRRELYRLAAKIPGPPGWPIIGNAHLFLPIKSSQDLEGLIRKVAGEYGAGIAKIWICSRLAVTVSDPEYIETLINNPSVVHRDELIYKPATILLGEGLVTRNGEKWARMRKQAVRVLNPKSITGFEDKIQKRLEILCKVLDAKADSKEVINITHYVTLFCFDLVIEAQAGVETMNELETNSTNFPTIVEDAADEATLCAISLLSFLHINPATELKKVCHQITQISEKIMRAKQEGNTSGEEGENKKCLNMMDVVTSTGEQEKLNFYETCKIANDFLVAGSDTPGRVMGGLLLMIAIHQDIQERLYQETQDVFGFSDRPAEKKDLDEMKYLEMVLSEGLRHFGPVLTARRIDSNLPLGGFILPKGCLVIFMHYYASFNPKFFERPYSFYPEHFLPGAKQSRPKAATLPFITGPRGCPGKQYAMQVMKRTISTIVRRYHLTTDIEYHQVIYKFHLQRGVANPMIKLSRRI
uniref:Cytochrome P450 4c21 n=1 Tax=Lygus hesperus TaxID=30085 RepID=A0A0A9XIK1_LYGHE